MDHGFIDLSIEMLQDLQHAQSNNDDLKQTSTLEKVLLFTDRGIRIDEAAWSVEGRVKLSVSGDLPDSDTGQLRLFYTYDEPNDVARKLTLKVEPYRAAAIASK